MKKLFLILTVFSPFIFHSSFSYGQSWEWGGQGTRNGQAYSNCVATDHSANAYVVGFYQGNNMTFGNQVLNNDSIGCTGSFLVKYDSTGTLQWATQAVGDAASMVSDATNKTGNVYAAGDFYGANGGMRLGNVHLGGFGDEAFLVKYTPSGNVLWALTSATPNDANWSSCYNESTATDKFGNVFVTGFFEDTVFFGSYILSCPYNLVGNTGYGNYCPYLVKYDSNGNLLWATQGSHFATATVNHVVNSGNAVATDKFGNSYITGTFKDTMHMGSLEVISPSRYNVFLAKFNPNGDVLWIRQSQSPNYPNSSARAGYGVATDMAGNVYITGGFTDTIMFNNENLFNGNVFFAKYDSNGNLAWAKQASGTGPTPWVGCSLSSDSLNHIYLAACGGTGTLKIGSYSIPTITDMNETGIPAVLIQFDTAGNPLCSSSLHDGAQTSGTRISIAAGVGGKEVYMTGTFPDSVFTVNNTLVNGNGQYEPYVVKWTPCEIKPQGIDEVKTNETIAVYPNPFTNFTTVVVNTEGKHYLEVDDLTGRKLQSAEFTGKSYQLSVASGQLAPGMYFVRVFDSQNVLIGTSKIVVQ